MRFTHDRKAFDRRVSLTTVRCSAYSLPFTVPLSLRLLLASLISSLALVLLYSSDALAQSIYTCKDDSGRALTSDRPIPECAKRPMRELTSTGIVKSELPPPLTHDQLKQKEIDDERQRVANLYKAQETARNRALLIAYPNMASLEVARKRHIEDLSNEAAVVERRMAKEHRELVDLQAQLTTAGTGKAPHALKKQVDHIAGSILADNDLLARMREDIARTNQRYDDDAKRLGLLLRDPDQPLPSRADTAIGNRPPSSVSSATKASPKSPPSDGTNPAPSKAPNGGPKPANSAPLASR